MSDNSPMLHQEKSNDVMLGGDRRAIPCDGCGSLMIRDFFGNPVCLECLHRFEQLEKILKSPVCPDCGYDKGLDIEYREGAQAPDRSNILYVWCYWCGHYHFLHPHYSAEAFERGEYQCAILNSDGTFEDIQR